MNSQIFRIEENQMEETEKRFIEAQTPMVGSKMNFLEKDNLNC
jgi:hypothetical protein